MARAPGARMPIYTRSTSSCPAEDLDSPLAAQWCPECDPDGPMSTRRSIAIEPRLWCPEAEPEARLCDNCSRALQKPLVRAQCKTATYCSKDCQVHTPHQNGAESNSEID
jgi:hypothetical protein